MNPDLLLGQRISEYRQKQGRSQAVVAGLCGITEDYLSRIERGVKTPTLQVLIDISRELRVPVAALLGETSSAPERPSTPHMATEVAQALLGNTVPPRRLLRRQRSATASSLLGESGKRVRRGSATSLSCSRI